MSSDPAIRIRGLSKAYQIAQDRQRASTLVEAVTDRLKHPFRRSETETFWALRDIDFEIERGEVVGIIGRNGAGKSTLLKILSRITEPTTGRIELYGRVGSLLEVGTGFHPELTGRENIYLNGAILGMKRSEIRRQFDAIVDFAGVEQFLDTPVKRYSSGMYVRLAFAVAAHLNPEILIVDEVLAVGDAEFQNKCLGKMRDVAEGGRTVLFVSHNLGAVRQFCRRGLMLSGGIVAHQGDINSTTSAYAATQGISSDHDFDQHIVRIGNVGRIRDVYMEIDGHRVRELSNCEKPSLVIDIDCEERCLIGIELILREQNETALYFAPSGLAQGIHFEIFPSQSNIVRCDLPIQALAAGAYSIDLIFTLGRQVILAQLQGIARFAVSPQAIGPYSWIFRQSGGQGCQLWDIDFQVGSDSSTRIVRQYV